jgi:hypothetical protein
MLGKFRLPSPAIVVALIALFVALGGTAVAASPVVKRALLAENALKLQGKPLTAVVQQAAAEGAKLPGPASTAAGLVSTKTVAAGSLAPRSGREFPISCDSGKVVSAGYSSSGDVISWDSRPTGDTSWSIYLGNVDSLAAADVSLYAVCVG